MLVFVLVMVIIPIIVLVSFSKLDSRKEQNINQLIKSFNDCLRNKYGMSGQYFFVKYNYGIVSAQDIPENHACAEGTNYIWRDGYTLNMVKKPMDHNLKNIAHERLADFMPHFQFNIGDIEYFHLTGQKLTVTKGSGGGSSLGGAVAGGILFGGVGAVVGSRKTAEINTEIVDDRGTVLVYNNSESNMVEHIVFSPDSYDVFLRLIPEKDLTYMQNRQQ